MGRRKKWSLAPLVCGAILAATTALAWAAPAAVTTSGNSYSAPVFNHEGGTVAVLSHTGGGPHNAVSAATGSGGQPMFSSGDPILFGTDPISGTQFVPAGDYLFYCTVHGSPTSGMRATLRVTGTPLPRPDSAYGGLSAQSKKKKCKKLRGKKRKRCLRKNRRR